VSAIFVTATGTDVGKTFVTAGLIRHLRGEGKTVAALKPIVSGFDPTNAVVSDPALLLTALGRPVNLDEIARIAPWRFRAPLSPDMAAKKEGGSIDFNAVVDFCRRAIDARRGTLFIEGIGGVMVPLGEGRTVLDLIEALALPVVLVAGSYLGTLSHTLSAINVLKQRGLQIAAVVVSETPESPVPLAETAATIAPFALPAGVVAIPRLQGATAEHSAFAEIAALL
jgi:dethiobiotin synthetase